MRGAAFNLPVTMHGNVAAPLQPARGYDRDETAAYHDPDLVPPHAYVAAYLWLRHAFGAHAGARHRQARLAGVAARQDALDGASYPALLWGTLPHLYPFIVNDPGEGTQAKRRTGAVIIDHLVPPLTRAETYGPLKDLEALLDEQLTRRAAWTGGGCATCAGASSTSRAIRASPRTSACPRTRWRRSRKIDTFLCDLKEAQIRDGLHVSGSRSTDELERDLLAALARVPRGERAEDRSLIRALADDLALGFDPLTAELGAPWDGPGDWRRVGDAARASGGGGG